MRVLLIEDDSATASAIELMLKTDGVDVYITGLGEEGIDLAKVYDYDAILLDLNLPDMSGYEVLRTVRASGVATPIIVSSALGSITDISKAFDLEADDYAVKPFTGESLIRKIRAATRQHAISKSKDDLSRFRKARKDDMIERATFDFYLHFLNTSNMEPDNKVVTGIISSFNFDAAAESMLVKAVSSATPMRLSQICNSVKELLARQLLVAANITWKGREGDDVSLTPPQFIQKYYAVDIALGTLTQSKIRQADLSLYTAFYNWRRANKDIPLGFEFPTKHEQTEVLLKQAAESDLEPGAQPARLSWAAQSRARRAKGTPERE